MLANRYGLGMIEAWDEGLYVETAPATRWNVLRAVVANRLIDLAERIEPPCRVHDLRTEGR